MEAPDKDVNGGEAEAAQGPARLKLCLTCSHGGHLTEMLALQEAFAGHDVFYFCYDAETTRRLPNAYLVPNMATNPVEFLKNLFRVLRILRRERPDLVISTGAEIALPMVLVAKLFRLPVLYIECGAQVTHPSFTGRIMCRLADRFYVHWPELLRRYGTRAALRGSLIDRDDPVPGDRSDEKRLRVTLIQPAQRNAFASDQPPMGLAYIASALQRQGCEVRVIDANVERLDAEQVAAIVAQQEPGLVCYTVTTPLFPETIVIAKALRQLRRPPLQVAGGPHATVLPNEFLESGLIDYVVRGEGENTIAELVEALIAQRPVAGIAGLSWRDAEGIHTNPDRALAADIDAFPRPDWSLFPLHLYSSLARRNDFSLPIATSRGCPFGCAFCYKGIYGRKLRMRSPENVVDEWAFLIERYGAHEIAVLDDAFTFEADRAMAICNLLIERGLNRVPWSTTNGIRVDNASVELLSLMRKAGCYRVYFGIESGVQSIIDSLHKRITLEQVKKAVAAAHEAGLEAGGYFMVGNVGETRDDMKATIAFAQSLNLDYAQFSIATPYPGTEMYERVLKEGRLLINSWNELATYGTGVFIHGEINPQMVGRMFRRAIRGFYFRPRYMLRQARELLTPTGIRHRFLAGVLLAKLALLGGKRKVTLR